MLYILPVFHWQYETEWDNVISGSRLRLCGSLLVRGAHVHPSVKFRDMFDN